MLLRLVIGAHILAGLTAVTAGLGAMRSPNVAAPTLIAAGSTCWHWGWATATALAIWHWPAMCTCAPSRSSRQAGQDGVELAGVVL